VTKLQKLPDWRHFKTRRLSQNIPPTTAAEYKNQTAALFLIKMQKKHLFKIFFGSDDYQRMRWDISIIAKGTR
jgi:hypothetical protein